MTTMTAPPIQPIEGISHDCRTVCLPGHPGAEIIAVQVNGNTRQVGTVCTVCLPDMLRHPDCFPGIRIVGTHLLTDEILEVLFPDE